MGVSEFLIKQVVHGDIRYFSCNIRKGEFPSQTMKAKNKDRPTKLFNKHKHPLNWLWFVFSQMRKSSACVRWWTHRRTVSLLCFHKWTNIEKNEHLVHMMLFGVDTSDGDIMPTFLFPPEERLKLEADIRCLENVVHVSHYTTGTSLDDKSKVAFRTFWKTLIFIYMEKTWKTKNKIIKFTAKENDVKTFRFYWTFISILKWSNKYW